MHGDTKIIQQTFKECVDLLTIFSLKEFVVCIVETISNLIQHSILVAKDAVIIKI